MKALEKLIIGYISTGLLAATAFAQATTDQPNSGATTGTDPSVTQPSTTLPSATMQPGSQGQEFFHARNFIGTKVKDQQGQSLGDIKDIVFSPWNGETFAAFDASNNRYYLVPWQALTITSTGRGKEQVSLNVNKQQLEAGPSIPRNQWQQLSNPTFSQSIYSHYNLQPPPQGMGGVGSRGMGGSLKGGSSSSSSSQDQTPK